jgi:hypothetical protein
MSDLSFPPRARTRGDAGNDAAALVLLAAVCLAVALVAAFRGGPTRPDLSDVSDLLHLDRAQRLESALSARIVDPKWDRLDAAAKERLTGALLDREARKGVRFLTLVDGSSRVRASARKVLQRNLVTIDDPPPVAHR